MAHVGKYSSPMEHLGTPFRFSSRESFRPRYFSPEIIEGGESGREIPLTNSTEPWVEII